MSRVTSGVTTHRRHKKITDQAKGYYGRRKNTFKVATQAVDKANQLLDDFSNMLKKRGIKVDRPTPLNFNHITCTCKCRHLARMICRYHKDYI